MRRLSWAGSLEVADDNVRWCVTSDVEDLRDAIEQARWADLPAPEELLPGMEAKATVEFEEWLFQQRWSLRQQWRAALFDAAAEAEQRGSPGRGARLLRPMLDTDDADLVLHRYMELLVLAGERAAATAAYDLIASGAATRAWSLRSRPPRSPPGSPGTGPRTNPERVNGTVARNGEVTELAGLLSRIECRLLTLLGPGGIGKSTLAEMLVRRVQPTYADGAGVVSLDAVNDPGDVPSRIAIDLGVALDAATDAGEQIRNALRRKHRLVVLDNVEHLPGAWPFFAELLAACPQLDLVATSRERLRLPEEWVFQVEGMADDDAIELFGERAQHVTGRLEIDRDEALGVCRAVGGSPLGIELAAPWLRVMSCADIIAEIGGDPGLLSGGGAGVLTRHRSVEAAMAHSWRLATPTEREAIEALAMFSARFTRQLAREVADTSPLVLRDLVDKSLLQAHPDGRYGFHPLVRQYAAARLAADPARQSKTRDCHARAILHQITHTSAAPLDTDILEDAVRAWRHAIATSELDLAARATEGLVQRLKTAGRCQQGLELLGSVPDDDVPAHQALIGAVGCGRAELLLSTGRHEQAAEAAERAIRAAAAADDDRVRVLAGLTLGWARKWTDGDGAQYEVTRQLLPIAEALHDDAVIADVFNALGCSAPALEECRDHLRAGVAAAEQANRPLLQGTCMHNLGCVLWGLGDTEAALSYLGDTLAMARSAGIRWAQISSLTMLAFVHGERSELARAQQLATEAENLAQDSEFTDYNIGATLVAGEICRLAGDVEGARSRMGAGLKMAVGQGTDALTLRALRLHGLTLLDEDQPRRDSRSWPSSFPRSRGRGTGPARSSTPESGPTSPRASTGTESLRPRLGPPNVGSTTSSPAPSRTPLFIPELSAGRGRAGGCGTQRPDPTPEPSPRLDSRGPVGSGARPIARR